MEIYCLKCKTKTPSNDLMSVYLKNGSSAIRGKCVTCGSTKYVITPKPKNADGKPIKAGGSILNTLLTNLPLPEMHMRLPKTVQSEYRPSGSFNNTGKYSFCGPFTKLQKRLAEGYSGKNKLDQACLQHDIAYTNSTDVKERNRADDILANKAAQIVMETDAPDYEKQDSRFVTGVMGTKSRFGM